MDGRERVAAFFDNTLDEAGQAELAEWIAESPENARFFAEWSVLEDQIGERYGVVEVLRADKHLSSQGASMRLAGQRAPRPSHRVWPWLLAAAAIVLLVAVAAVWSPWSRPTGTLPVANTPPGGGDASLASVAMLVGQRSAVWGATTGHESAAPVPGDRLGAGERHLLEGVAHLRTESGTNLLIEGPARFELVDDQTLRLVSGRVYGEAAGSAKGFTLKSNRVDMDGCSRSFGMFAGPDTSMCQVYSGTADVLSRNNDGDVQYVSRLMPNQSLTVGADGRVTLGRLDPSALVRTLEPSELGIGRAYVQAVHASGPTDYWRFEQLDGGDIYNEVPGRPALRVQSIGGGLVLSEDVQNRHLQRTAVTGEFLVSTEKLRVNSDRYSIECWVRNDNAGEWTTLFAFQAFPKARTELEFGLIQLEMLPAAEGDAEAGHRVVLTHAHRAGHFPQALSSQPDRDAESWHHLVLVRDGKDLQLYRDGQPWASTRARMPGTTMDVVLVVGRNGITPGGHYRLFRGSLDEVALYDRPLTEQEIRSHYEAMRHPPQRQGAVQ
jgi:hypothetical protein